MTTDTSAIFRTLGSGRVRLLIRAAAARAGGIVALCGALIAIDLLGLIGRPVLIVVGAAALPVWIGLEWRRLSTPVVAARLDRTGGTHDTLGTAIWLIGRSGSSPWAEHQLERATGVAERLAPLPVPAGRLAIVAAAVLALVVSFGSTPAGHFSDRTALVLGPTDSLGRATDSPPLEQEAGAAQDEEENAEAEIETVAAGQEAGPGDVTGDAPPDGLAGEVRASADGQEPTRVAGADDLGERLREPGGEQSADAAAADENTLEGAPGQMLSATQAEAAAESAEDAGMSLPGQEFRWAEAALAEKPPPEEGAQATSGDTSGAGEGGDPQLGDPTQLAVERELERLDAQEPAEDEEAEEIERASRAGPSRRGFRAAPLAGQGEPPRAIRRAPHSWEDRRRIGEFFEREPNEHER